MNESDTGLVAGILALPILVILFLWLIVALVAAAVAPIGRRLQFFIITLFFLGPLGIAAAAVAQPRPPRYGVAPAPRPAVASTPMPLHKEGPPPEPIDLNLPPLGSGKSPADFLVRHMRKGDKRDK